VRRLLVTATFLVHRFLALSSSETSVLTRATRRNIPEYAVLLMLRCSVASWELFLPIICYFFVCPSSAPTFVCKFSLFHCSSIPSPNFVAPFRFASAEIQQRSCVIRFCKRQAYISRSNAKLPIHQAVSLIPVWDVEAPVLSRPVVFNLRYTYPPPEVSENLLRNKRKHAKGYLKSKEKYYFVKNVIYLINFRCRLGTVYSLNCTPTHLATQSWR
jgi:hypothetical protein